MIDFETIKKQNKLTTYNEYIYVKPIDEYNYITYPLTKLEGCLAITLEQYLGLRANYYKFNEKLTELVVRE